MKRRGERLMAGNEVNKVLSCERILTFHRWQCIWQALVSF